MGYNKTASPRKPSFTHEILVTSTNDDQTNGDRKQTLVPLSRNHDFSFTCRQTASTGGVHSAKRDWIIPKALGLLATNSDGSSRVPNVPLLPARAAWSTHPVDVAETNRHTLFPPQRHQAKRAQQRTTFTRQTWATRGHRKVQYSTVQ